MPQRSQVAIFAVLAANLLWPTVALCDENGLSPIRFATFNVSLNRPKAGQLLTDLNSQDNAQAKKVAEIIQRVRPDVLLLNEFDYDAKGIAADRFQSNYLAMAQGTQEIIRYKHRYLAPVNTGVPSGHDLDGDGKDNGPGDGFGFGAFPGQYGMLVLSRFPIHEEGIRTFQTFLWRDMPNALLPQTSAGPFYDDSELEILRLSSKSHWDVPIQCGSQTIHFLCAHPTPPVFDGPEDRNGRRNHDEIRFWADYITQDRSDYIYDDAKQRGGLGEGKPFVIAGDMNADPLDGDSTSNAINQLLAHPLVNSHMIPNSRGAIEKARRDGGANDRHRNDSAYDTSDFNDRSVGNLRLDYTLPSKSLTALDAGVFWPFNGESGRELVAASDHRLTWIDINL
ncbi:MAG: endonuclease/exonuclease/phosphatase family protein [Planctomycetes bacterium]|nr:endonuclease/exonuclease/phosphatase family protein [Planctomycetota bacterium]